MKTRRAPKRRRNNSAHARAASQAAALRRSNISSFMDSSLTIPGTVSFE
jgi:hypothetical protein